MDADGSNVSQLTHDTGGDHFPTWSPDGSHIAFVSEALLGMIYVVDADGSNLRQLTTDGGYSSHNFPAWSPDGSRIAFVTIGNDAGLFVVNADGSNATRLCCDGSPQLGFDSSWSPDSSLIAFSGFGPSDRAEVYVIHGDGSNLAQITQDGGFDPAWSPDGDRILFGAWPAEHPSPSDCCTELYLMHVDGSNRVQLTHGTTSSFDASWSPDGSKIVFITSAHGVGGIYTMDPDGTNVVQLL